MADLNQAEPPDISDSAYGTRLDRNARYQDNAPEEIERSNSTLDNQGDENAADDVAMPADRFAQPAGGVSFDELERVDDTNATDEPEDMDQRGSAPRFSMAQPEDRFVSRSELAGEETDDGLDGDQDDRGVVLAPVPGDEGPDDESPDESHVEPFGEDRFTPRGREQRSPSRATVAMEEADDDAAEPADDLVVDSPRRLRQPDDDSYTVEPNDNFWRVSQKVYGTGAYFKALEEHNRRQAGARTLINVGDAISTPPLSVLQQNYPDLCPKPRKLPSEGRGGALVSSPARGGRTYTVAEGDTLFDIARAELGKASRWAEIYELNRDQLGEDFNYLAPGMQLVMPPRGDRPESITTRPSRDAYRR
jgi:nucleoid-associated protein YgaU